MGQRRLKDEEDVETSGRQVKVEPVTPPKSLEGTGSGHLVKLTQKFKNQEQITVKD